MGVSRCVVSTSSVNSAVDSELSCPLYSTDQALTGLYNGKRPTGEHKDRKKRECLKNACCVDLTCEGLLNSTMRYPLHSTPHKPRGLHRRQLKVRTRYIKVSPKTTPDCDTVESLSSLDEAGASYVARKKIIDASESLYSSDDIISSRRGSPAKIISRGMVTRTISAHVATLLENASLVSPDASFCISSEMSSDIKTTTEYDRSESYHISDICSTSLTSLGPRPLCIGMEDPVSVVKPAESLIDSVLSGYDVRNDATSHVTPGSSESNRFNSRTDLPNMFKYQAGTINVTNDTITLSRKKDIKKKLRSFLKTFHGVKEPTITTLAVL